MVRRIVVIEDQPDLEVMLSQALEEERFSVVGLTRPELLQKLLQGLDPDLFLIDLMLPSINGIDLASQLRATRFADTPIIAMSGSSELIRDAVRSGLFQDVLAKPFDLKELLDTIEHHLGHHETRA